MTQARPNGRPSSSCAIRWARPGVVLLPHPRHRLWRFPFVHAHLPVGVCSKPNSPRLHANCPRRPAAPSPRPLSEQKAHHLCLQGGPGRSAVARCCPCWSRQNHRRECSNAIPPDPLFPPAQHTAASGRRCASSRPGQNRAFFGVHCCLGEPAIVVVCAACAAQGHHSDLP